jgi:signal transduction histidine kinase
MQVLNIFKLDPEFNPHTTLSLHAVRSRLLFRQTFLFWTIVGSIIPFLVAYDLNSVIIAASSLVLSVYIGIIYYFMRKGKEIIAKILFTVFFALSLVYTVIAYGEFGRASWLLFSFIGILFSLFQRMKFWTSAFICLAFYISTSIYHLYFEPFFPVTQKTWYDVYIGSAQLVYITLVVSFQTQTFAYSKKLSQAKQVKLRQANAELMEHKLALERVNKELHQFASCASHDMREPLRTISSFSSLVKNRLPAEDKNQDLLEFVTDAAKRMTLLLDDLISYTRVTQIEVHAGEWTDLNEVMADVKKNLLLKITESEATIQFMQMPIVMASKTHMILLLQNLISNSIKYASTERKPYVQVNWVKKDDGIALLVKDNGIGIEQKYCADIFEPFRRLHPIGRYEGSGIGLATCRKVAERYRGHISATSEYGYSTTILVDLTFQLKPDQVLKNEIFNQVNALNKDVIDFVV